ncbi:MAG: hypothetical protein ABL964_13765 [Steroidobacteraceae bacterium]
MMKPLLPGLLLILLPAWCVASDAPLPLAEVRETGRDGCIHSESARSLGAGAYVDVCIRESGPDVLVSRHRQGEPESIFAREPRTAAGFSAYLVTTRQARQWLLLESQGKAPGSSWVLWDLNSGSRIMHGRSSNIPYIRDLDADGLAELVVFDDLLITPTTLWQDEAFGLPRVYRLAEAMEARSLRDYPDVVRDFLAQAEIAIEAFTAPCIDMPPVDRRTEENCKEMAGFAASATKARDFAALFLSGRPPPR